MAVTGGLGEDKVSCTKQGDLKVHPMKGSWRSGNSVEPLVFVVFSHCELLGISFFQPSCCGYHFIKHLPPPPRSPRSFDCFEHCPVLWALGRAGRMWLGVGGKVQVLSALSRPLSWKTDFHHFQWALDHAGHLRHEDPSAGTSRRQ